MSKFKIRLTRDLSESCDITIDAPDEDTAQEIAIGNEHGQEENWSIDDGNDCIPYVTDCEEVI